MHKIGVLALSVSLTLASSPKRGAKSTCLSLRERWICEAKTERVSTLNKNGVVTRDV